MTILMTGGDPYFDTTEEWGWDAPEVEGCLHGVSWCEPCHACEWEDELTWIECGYY
jgi:hypothetical protein